MFELLNKGVIRKGTLKTENNSSNTPCFFITSNFGGGGTNVARLLAYSDLIINVEANLLLNYYYIDINSDASPKFDTELVRNFESMSGVQELIKAIKKGYLQSSPRKSVDEFSYSETTWRPLVLLDSGSGNILRNHILNGTLTPENFGNMYRKIVDDYLDFILKHRIDIGIAMDFAKKNTYKANEKQNTDYMKKANFFATKNDVLLDITLQEMKKKNGLMLFAPVHGDSLEEYRDYLNMILSLEEKEGVRFAGFAIGGLGNPNTISRDLWNIRSEVNGKVKAALYLHKIVDTIRSVLVEKRDDRPIHVLGAASPQNILPLLLAGADTFDCHSAWRRASDGNETSKPIVRSSIGNGEAIHMGDANFSKVLIPLLDNEGNVIEKNANKYLAFVPLHQIDTNYVINDGVFSDYNIDVVKKLYSGNAEENYFAKILLYIHAVQQYERLCKRFSGMNSHEEVEIFMKGLPDCEYKKDMIAFLSFI